MASIQTIPAGLPLRSHTKPIRESGSSRSSQGDFSLWMKPAKGAQMKGPLLARSK